MGKGIKTREVVKEIKIHDTAVNVGERIKNVGIKSKETISENINQVDNVSPEQYAADKVSEAMQRGTETVVVSTEKTVRKGVKKATEQLKKKRAKKKAIKDGESFENEVDTKTSEQEVDGETEKGDNSSTSTEKQEQTDKPKNNNANKKDGDTQTKANADNPKENASKNEKQQNTKKDTKSKTDNAETKAVDKKKTNTTVKEKNTRPQPNEKTESAVKVEEIKKPRQKSQAAPKTKGKPTIKRVNQENQSVKTINNNIQKIKQTKKSLDGAAKGIKTADKSVKTAKATAKTTANTTKKTAEATRRTAEATKAAAKATANTVKAVAKAIVEGAKSLAAAVKSLAALIAEGGVPAVVVIIIICLVGAIGGTCFGIFLANDESTGTEKTISATISDLTSEHYERLTELKSSYTYDLLEIQGDMSVNWKDVLAVYAVKTTSGDTPLEVVTLDDVKINLIRTIMNDMNKLTGAVSPKVVSETTVTTDADGNTVRTVTYTTKQVLTITIQKLTIDEIVTQYSFNQEQKNLLTELMSEEYSDLWAELLGASGQIIQGNSSFVGTSIFAWPFENDQYISSRFGTRVDPFTGAIRTHGGTDIAAPMGTPILASAAGTVVAATWHNSYGYYVKIKHNETYSTLYAHCSALHVSVGQTVSQGQVIADCGSTGNSTGPHCHFEVIQNGVRVDALMFFN